MRGCTRCCAFKAARGITSGMSLEGTRISHCNLAAVDLDLAAFESRASFGPVSISLTTKTKDTPGLFRSSL
jgi:hypothetical protein